MGYVDEAGFDFHLAAGAAAVDHGDPLDHPATDIDGDPRVDGLPDAGADERPEAEASVTRLGDRAR
jgi:hypothetical protein